MLTDIQKDLFRLKSSKKSKILSRFFKTGDGEYGAGDIFLGITVPKQRKTAKKYHDLPLDDIQSLLFSKIHEHRLTALLILADRYKKSDAAGKKSIADFYLSNARRINNWDLVDLSSHRILGDYLLDKKRSALYSLARSKNIWERRIAIISTYAFIRKNDFDDTLKISEMLIRDRHDLIHKAVGWMLREVGKRDQNVEEMFLMQHYRKMPRTMLRYAIERFSKPKKKFYMKR